VFGHGVCSAIWADQRAQDIERAVQEHLDSHTVHEWIETITQLTRERDESVKIIRELESKFGSADPVHCPGNKEQSNEC